MNPSQKCPSSLNVRFIANSSRIHGAFMSLSWHFPVSPTAMSDSSRIHVTFMAVSWHFHIQALPGYSLSKSIGKSYPKSRCWLSLCFFCLISSSFLAICQIHVGFMALSWRFVPSDFYYFSKQFHGTCMADSWEFHGAFMALSCHFPGTFSFGHVWICHESAWKCHESAKPRWNLHVRFMSICVCLFLSVCRQCFFDVIFIDGFWGSSWSIFSGVFFDQNIGL